ncbi:MASE1 domain-containing protein [Streptomyces himalayensis]|uniref:MASE1 domain-containing protein n=1 Tax=Streptomyces himalayensis subsp. himalayensis TaxID=2756131 RepID=A0A7W0DJ63_9ACTN|nr:MASE1 domain-containing protein [Streptomyces himalayensis]MBA2946064.1 MASE1 domain-containing protein [Streptomyces himalayensis subsp. himalayensis]
MTAVARSNERLRHCAALGLRIAAVAAVYYAAARIGLMQELVRGQITPFWPPTGIALVGLLLWGIRIWPGIAIGAFLVNVSLGPSILPVVAIAVGNTLAPVCAYLLLGRAGFRIEMDRLRDALALVFLGALGGMLISPTLGTGVLVLSGALAADEFWPAWSVWWTGDAMGVLVVAPLLLAIRTYRWPRGVPVHRWAEAAALLAGTAVVGAVATRSTLGLLFLVFPCLIWAAFRFQLAGAAPCVLIVSVIAIDAGTQGVGPFSGHDLLAKMVTLQALNGSVALTALLLAVTITERDRTRREIEQVCRRLTEALARLTPVEKGEAWPPTRSRKERGRDA